MNWGKRDPDQTIYQALLRREPAAMEHLLRRYGHQLREFIWGQLEPGGSAQEVEEVLNDTLLQVWTGLEEYDPQRAPLGTWLFLQALYCALSRRKRLQRESRQLAQLSPDLPQVDPPTMLRLDLCQALLELNELDRQVLYLCDYLGWSGQAVADRLGLRRGAVYTRLHRSRKRLQRLLQDWRPQLERLEEARDE